jgi:hypothetical protein
MTYPSLKLRSHGDEKEKGEIGDYLYEIFSNYADDHFGWSKVMNIAMIAYLIYFSAVLIN